MKNRLIDKRKSSLIVCLISLVSISNLFAQTDYSSPYRLSWKQESILMGTGTVTTVAGIILGFEMDPLSADAIAQADRNQIWAIDRRATRYWSISAHRASDWGRNISYALPVLVLIDKRLRKDFWSTAFIGTEAYLLTSGLTALTKIAARRERPYVYNPDAPFENKNSRSARLSFFSGHTSTTAALCFVSAKMYLDHHPNSSLKPVIWATAATIPAMTGYFRYRAGRHFPTDVIVGYAIGAGIGWLIPTLHHKKNLETGFYLEPRGSMGGQGVAIGWRW